MSYTRLPEEEIEDNYQDPKPVKWCDHCGKPIYISEKYYNLEGAIWCEDCVWEAREYAEG